GGAVLDAQLVVIVEAVGDVRGEGAGEAHLAIGRYVAELDADRTILVARLGLPDLGVEAFWPAMQGVRTIVLRDLVGAAIELETPVGNAVAETADGGAEVDVAVLDIAVHIVEAEHDVLALAVLVRHDQGLQDAAVGDDGRLDAVAVLLGIFLE